MKFWQVFERYGALSLGMLTTLICLLLTNTYELAMGPELDNLFNVVITSTSIIIGFVGVLFAILFSMLNTNLLRVIFRSNGRVLLKKYITQPINMGFIVLVLSTVLLLRFYLPNQKTGHISLAEMILAIWAGCLVFLIIATYRVIKIVSNIIFSDNNFDDQLNSFQMTKEQQTSLIQKNASN